MTLCLASKEACGLKILCCARFIMEVHVQFISLSCSSHREPFCHIACSKAAAGLNPCGPCVLQNSQSKLFPFPI